MVLISGLLCCIDAKPGWSYSMQQVPPDSLQQQSDTLDAEDTSEVPAQPYKPSIHPELKFRDRYGSPMAFPQSRSPFLMKDPSNYNMSIKVDTGLNYSISERMGDVHFRPRSSMTFEEYDRLHSQRMIKDYWKEQSAGLDGESAVSGRRLIPPIYISPVFDRIFGGSYVDIKPNGFVTLDFGGQWQRVQNPDIPIRQQRSGGFEFDQQISMNVVGEVGDKLAITANFDNNNSFDFQNNLKVEYTGYEEDIIQKIEIGNVSLPLQNSLISGAQNLFGVKTQLRFGDLYMTAVASTQRGKNESITINSGIDGGQGREFEIRASEYEENRHFFLGHFFRQNYEGWLRAIPQILSRVKVNNLEVYVINRQNNTQTLRNFAAFMDLGEGNLIYNKDLVQSNDIDPSSDIDPADNDANNLYEQLIDDPRLRSQDDISNVLTQELGMIKGTEFTVLTSARKLSEQEYNFNEELGILSLVRRLQNDEVLAVSFSYTYQGRKYQVGELQSDYQNRDEKDIIFLKMLRPAKINPDVPTWDLMMKNVYNLNASQVTQEGFQLRIMYRDDNSGVNNPSLHEGEDTKNVPLIELVGLDRLNPANDPQKDGNFDFVEGVTILPENGLIFFPVLEPFGNTLASYFNEETESGLIQKYVYDTLYETTKADAELDAFHNKYYITGRMQAGSASEIMLPGINVSEGSVVITAGNTPLTEGVDYRVDYNIGRVTIINESVLNSGKEIKINFEKADLFNFQTRSLIGTRLDYNLNEKLNIGGTMLYHNERPFISRVSIGEEPTRNLKYGFDINYQDESRLLTKMVDALPVIETKVPSNITFNAEFAQLLPGTSNKVDGVGTSYIDDFEATATPFSLSNGIQAWNLAATPRTEDERFTMGAGEITNDLRVGYKRAKLAWYIIDNIFYRSGGRNKPDNITDEDTENHYVRDIAPQEIFTNRDLEVVNTNLPIFDMAYYPSERGPYNYNPNIEEDGTLPDPESNWGGITRAITSDVDFDRNNIEYIEFWLMDPFIEGENGVVDDGRPNPRNNTTGGKLVFNLGSISEDIMKDSRHAFEHGLPEDGDSSEVVINEWGRVTQDQFLTNAFANSPSARENQDIGLDGLQSTQEAAHPGYQDFVNAVNSSVTPDIRDQILNDLSNDDFRYYLGDELDAADAGILERYKNFNNMEGNSPILENNTANFTPSGTTLPDNEDVNEDNTLSDLEEYYEYEVELESGAALDDHKYVVDKVTTPHSGDQVSCYLFRKPVREPTRVQGEINGFKSIRFMRMYLTEFAEPVVLRMGKFQLVGTQWRKYQGNLYDNGLYEFPEPDDSEFIVSVVNIEENGNSEDGKIPYVVPPGIRRDLDNTSPLARRANEQSMSLCLDGLQDKNAKAVFKNVNLDLINYGKLRMFIHAQENGHQLEDGEVSAFVRMGNDLEANYYEVEIPLKITPPGSTSPTDIWPAENELVINFDDLYAAKTKRDRENFNIERIFTDTLANNYKVTVRGRPELSGVQTMMIGVRNPESPPDESAKSVCVWVNEMRVTDFDRTAGWATNAFLGLKLADLGTVNASTRYTTFGFGGIQSRIQERTREEILEYDVSTNLNLDKFIPGNTGLKVPMYASIQKRIITPQFDPIDPDIPLEVSLNAFETQEERDEYRKIVEDRTTRRSLNFTNVRKVKVKEDANKHIYDIENISLTYAYSDIERSNINTALYESKSHRGSFAYNYSPEPLEVAPLENSKALSSPYLQLIKDLNVNFAPSNLNFRMDVDRKFVKTQLRNDNLTTSGILPTWEKYFYFNRTYGLSWDLTRSLSVDYNARVRAIIDEPPGDIDTDFERQQIWDNFKDLGRMKNFNQNIGVNYDWPLDKLPITSWMSADTRYSIGYNWTAGAYSPDPELNQQDVFGNIIENNTDLSVSGKLDFVKLYNKNNFLKDINTPSRRRPTRRPQAQAEEDTIKKPDFKALKGLLRLLMSVRSVNINYSVRSGTILPGFNNHPFLLGMDSSWSAPGWKFILGSQNDDIRFRAAEEGWLVTDTLLNTPFGQLRQVDLNIRANIEPVSDFKIQLDAKKRASGSYEELFQVDRSADTPYQPNTPTRSGSYSISYNTISTAFSKINSEFENDVFKEFEENRQIIRDRLGAEHALNSQDVLIPAFLAAYSGQDASTVNLSPFPNIPIPSWRFDYAGLGKIPGLRDVFSGINITHGYSSTYSVNNFSNSLEYTEGLELSEGLTHYPRATVLNNEDELIPVFLMSQVMLQEEFSPLIGINVRTRNRFTARVEYRKKRDLALNFSNAQVTEIRSSDVSFDVGYTKSGMRLPFRNQGRVITLENDISFKMTFTIRDTKTIQRKFGEDSDPTNGNLNIRLNPQISYVLSDRLNINIYFERSINDPLLTNSFRRSTSAGGVQLRFNLAQ